MSEDQAATDPGVTSRRALLAGAGGVGAAVVLAACGDSGSTGSGGTTSGATTGAPRASGTQSTGPLAKTKDIPVGGGTIFAARSVVVTQPKAGEFKAFSNICTHQSCPVASVDGGTINCTCHGSKYSIEDGSPKNGPATRPLGPKQIKVEGDTISLA
jgi:nitrite reductase/ring-hydroxylating ferredoxin subunit